MATDDAITPKVERGGHYHRAFSDNKIEKLRTCQVLSVGILEVPVVDEETPAVERNGDILLLIR